MSVGEYCNRDVVVVEKSESVREAIKLMRYHHVGDVVVVEKTDEGARPLGVLTDRDIVIEILAEDVDLSAITISDVMSQELVTAEESSPFIDALQLMQAKGVRRLPIVDDRGVLVGVMTVDDVIDLVAEQMNLLVNLISLEQTHEQERRET